MAEGTQLGKYMLQRRLATGGMAEIWLAEQRGPGGFAKELVVKRILPHLANDAKFVEMFLDEARVAAQLTHPNIVQIYDLGEVAGSYFIAMEYIRGHDLELILNASLRAGGPLDPLAAARLIADACAGLDFAHNFADSRGRPMHLVHRDVSPQNILVSDQGQVKLVDFGVAKAATSTHKTQTGAVKGKFAYMSPEQISGKPLDGRSDLFAMGIVLFELLTGRRPFGHDSELMAVTAILHHPPPDVRELNPDVPLELRDIVERALEKDPTRRWQTAEEMQAALEGVLATSGVSVGRKTLATYVGSLFSDQPRSLASSIALVPTIVGDARPTEAGVPPSLRHGPNDQPTAKRTSGPGVHDRRTEQMRPAPVGSGPPATGPAERVSMHSSDTRAIEGRRGVSAGLWVAIGVVFLALAGAGYFLYATIEQKSGDNQLASRSDDAGGGATEPDAGGGPAEQVDAGGGNGVGEPDTGTTLASTDAGAVPEDGLDAGAVAETDVGTVAEVDAGVVAEVDATVVIAEVDAGALPVLDAGAIAEVDAGTIAEADAGTIAEADAGVVAEVDAGVVAEVDAGVVAEVDAGVVAELDAGTIAEPDADTIAETDAGAIAELDVGVVAEPDVGAIAELDVGAVAADDVGAVAADDVGAVAADDVGEADDALLALADVAVPDEPDAEAEDAIAMADDAAHVEERREERDRRPGHLTVVVSPPGRYEILIDDRVVGRTPLPRQELSPGRHRVEARRVGESSGTRQTVNIRAGRNETVTIDMR
jgi:serine/threonine protein kinase